MPLLLISCSTTAHVAEQSAPPPTNSALSALATPSKEDRDRENKALADRERFEQVNAVNDFITRNYPGWALAGISGDYVCSSGEPCELHLTKAGQSKIVAVIIENFVKPDGTAYWFVYEARAIDLAIGKLTRIKNAEREAVLENLDFDDCEAVIEDMRASVPDFRDDSALYEVH